MGIEDYSPQLLELECRKRGAVTVDFPIWHFQLSIQELLAGEEGTLMPVLCKFIDKYESKLSALRTCLEPGLQDAARFLRDEAEFGSIPSAQGLIYKLRYRPVYKLN